MRQVAASGRWVWGISGLITATALAVPGTGLILSAWDPPGSPADATTQMAAPSQPVTSLSVRSYCAPNFVTAGPVHSVQVADTNRVRPGGPCLLSEADGEPGRATGIDGPLTVNRSVRIEQAAGR